LVYSSRHPGRLRLIKRSADKKRSDFIRYK
jgi:hypothetical protein